MQKTTNTERVNFTKCFSIVISILALIVSTLSFINTESSRPLAYYIEPTITQFENNTFYLDVEFVVTNGAIGDFRVIDYRDGQIIPIANNQGGTIKKRGKCSFRILFNKENSGFIGTAYVLVHGKDGSRSLGMLLFYVDDMSGKLPLVKYYSQEDLLLAELDPNQKIIANALSNFRDLTNLLDTDENFK